VLDDLTHDRDAGRAQELVQLSEIVALFERGDAERALLGAPCSSFGAGLGLTDAALTSSLHRPSLVAPAASRAPR
jgi:cephalosporin-C deacetylase-like acetyl esterase